MEKVIPFRQRCCAVTKVITFFLTKANWCEGFSLKYCYLYLHHQRDEQDLCFSVMAPNDRWALALKGKYTHPQLSSSGSQCVFLKPLQLFCQLALELKEFGAFVGHIWVKERALGLSGTQPWGIPAWGKLNSFSTEKKSSVANRTGI